MTLADRFHSAVEMAVAEKREIWRIESYTVSGLEAMISFRSRSGKSGTTSFFKITDSGDLTGCGPYGNAIIMLPIIRKYMDELTEVSVS